MDGGAWKAAVHGVAKSRTQQSDFSFTFHFHALEKEVATHSSVLAWRIPGTGEPGGLPSMGSHESWTQLKWLSSSSVCMSIPIPQFIPTSWGDFLVLFWSHFCRLIQIIKKKKPLRYYLTQISSLNKFLNEGTKYKILKYKMQSSLSFYPWISCHPDLFLSTNMLLC